MGISPAPPFNGPIPAKKNVRPTVDPPRNSGPSGPPKKRNHSGFLTPDPPALISPGQQPCGCAVLRCIREGGVTATSERPARLFDRMALASETSPSLPRILPCGGGLRCRVGPSCHHASGASVPVVPKEE